MEHLIFVGPEGHPYSAFTIEASPNLGWSLFCRLPDTAGVLALVTLADSFAAWVPLVVMATPGIERELSSFLRMLDAVRPGQSVLVGQHTDVLPGPESVLQWVNSRPPISSGHLAKWIAIRLGRPELHTVLEAAMSQPDEPRRPSFQLRTLQRQVKDEVNCHVADLGRLARLATLKRLLPTVNHLADEAGTTPTVLRRHVTALLGVSLADYNERPGWEWPLEAACRRGLGARGWGLGAGG